MNLQMLGAGLLFLAASVSGAAIAQQPTKIPHIGFLRAESPDQLLDAFREGLRTLGYVDGESIVIDQRWAHGYLDRLPELANELVRLNVDVIVTASTPATLAAKRATSTIPIVIASSGDPVASGAVASLAHPGGNITGQTIMLEEVAIKRLEILKEAVPKTFRVAVLWSASNPVYAGIVKQLHTVRAARQGATAGHSSAQPRRTRSGICSNQEAALRWVVRLRGSCLPKQWKGHRSCGHRPAAYRLRRPRVCDRRRIDFLRPQYC